MTRYLIDRIAIPAATRQHYPSFSHIDVYINYHQFGKNICGMVDLHFGPREGNPEPKSKPIPIKSKSIRGFKRNVNSLIYKENLLEALLLEDRYEPTNKIVHYFQQKLPFC